MQSTPTLWFAGRVFMLTPNHAMPVSWQVTHVAAATTVWFIAVPAKLVKLPAAWQLSQVPDVGMWFPGFVFTVIPVKLLPVSWQVAQPLLMPVCTIRVPGPNAVVLLWHVAQSALVGMWPFPCAFGVTPVTQFRSGSPHDRWCSHW